MKITVIGGTGYAGKFIVNEAAKRAHEVISFSRSAPEQSSQNVTYMEGSAFDEENLDQAISRADIVVACLSPRGELQSKLGEVYATIARIADKNKVRLVVVGGFSTLKPAKNKPNFIDAGEVPADYAAEAKELADFYKWLSSEAPDTLDWAYVSPAAMFGSFNPGEAAGSYRVGGEVALFDEAGTSNISGSDFALAIVDEIEKPTMLKSVISFAY